MFGNERESEAMTTRDPARLYGLSFDSKMWVRAWVASNPATPIDVLERLLVDSRSQVRFHAEQALAKRQGGTPTGDQPEALCPECGAGTTLTALSCDNCGVSFGPVESTPPPPQQASQNIQCRNCNGIGPSDSQFCQYCGAPFATKSTQGFLTCGFVYSNPASGLPSGANQSHTW